jgi:hypothetical protein
VILRKKYKDMVTKYMTEDPKWVSFYPTFNNGFYLSKAGYFDERPELHTSMTQLIALVLLPILISQSWSFILLSPLLILGYGSLYIHLPIRTGIQDCDSAAWGVNYHDNRLWLYIGGGGNSEGGRKWITVGMPWELKWVRTSTKMKDGYDWFHETNNTRKTYEPDPEGLILGSYDWLEKYKWTETHPFVDKYDGTVVNATIGIVEREWRPKWFQWTSLFAKTSKTIDVTFDEEVGKRKGSWKGGTIGCGYELKPNETPYAALKRMEHEREF